MGVRHFTKTHAFINLINFCLTTNIKKSTKSFPLWYLFYSSVNLMWNIMNHWKTSWIIRFIIQLKFFKGTSNETNKRSLLSVHPLAFIIFCKYVFFVNWTFSICWILYSFAAIRANESAYISAMIASDCVLFSSTEVIEINHNEM